VEDLGEGLAVGGVQEVDRGLGKGLLEGRWVVGELRLEVCYG
jgi:hypothetical protein